MRHRHPLPRVWLMTDPRMGAALWEALERLPRGAGIVFRHRELPVCERRILLRSIAKVARRRGLLVLAAGINGPDGAHNHRQRHGLQSRSAHNRREIVAARRAGADLVFVSPVFATRSHADARALGISRFGLMIRGAGVPVIALGGMTARRARALAPLDITGWAGIDAWLPSRQAQGSSGGAVP